MELLAYLGALQALSLLDIGIPACFTARRLGLQRPWVALLPFGDVAMLGACAGRRGWSRTWPVLVIWLLPLLFGLASVALYVAMSPEERAASSSGGLPIVGAGIVPFVIIRHLWREVCWETAQSDRWIWLAGLPILGALRSWPIALRTPRADSPDMSGLGSPSYATDGAEAYLLRPSADAKDYARAQPMRDDGAPDEVVIGATPGLFGIPTEQSRQPSLEAGNEGPPNPPRPPWREALRLRPPAWLLSAITVLAVVAVFLWLDKSQLHWYAAATPSTATPTAPVAQPTVEPDRVVGVIRKCDSADEGILYRISRDGCEATAAYSEAARKRVLNDRLEVTVRTGSGGSYVVTVPPATSVRVGDVWWVAR